MCGLSTPAVRARRSCRPQRRAGRSPEALQVLASSPTCWSRSTPITCRSTARARSTPERASSLIARRSPTGWAGRASYSNRSSHPSGATCCARRRSTAMTPRCRCSARGAAAPSRGGCGRTCAMIGRPGALSALRCSSVTPRIARASGPRDTLPPLPACCRRMPMPGSIASTASGSRKRPAGHTCGASSTRSTSRTNPRSRPRR